MANRNKRSQAYDPAEMAMLKGVPLPDKLKCSRCNKFLNHANFSAKQLTDARRSVKLNGVNARYKINCQKCTGKQVVEIECTMCHKTKGLEEFAKSQRKKPDSAKCYACVDDQLAQDAVEDEAYEEPHKAFIPVEHSAGNYPEYWTSSTLTNPSEAGDFDDYRADDGDEGGIIFSDNFRKMSLNGSITNTLIESEYDLSSQNNDKDGWNTVESKSWRSKSTTAPSASSGFDANKYGKPQSRAASGSVTSSVRSFSSGYAERSDTTSYKNGWAKIKAYKPSAEQERAAASAPEANWESSSSEEDDDDDADDAESDGSDAEI